MNPRHYVLGMFAVLLAVCLVCPLNAQVSQPGTKQTVTAKPETVIIYVQANQPEKQQSDPVKFYDFVLKAFSWVLGGFSIILGGFSFLLSLITATVLVAGLMLWKDRREMREEIEREKQKIVEYKNEAQKCADEVKRSLTEAQLHADAIRKIEEEAGALIKGIKPPPLSETPSDDVKKKLDEFGKKIEILETLGGQLTPDDYFNKGFDLFYKGKYEVALNAFEKVVELDPNNAEAWDNKGIVLGKLERYEEALKAHEKAIDLMPRYANAWENKGVALGMLGRFEEALIPLDKAIELRPDSALAYFNSASTWFNKGVALGKLGRQEEALNSYNKAIELKHDGGGAWFNKACTHSLKGEKQNALQSLSKTIELDSTYKEKAKKDEDFKTLWTDPDFIKLVS